MASLDCVLMLVGMFQPEAPAVGAPVERPVELSERVEPVETALAEPPSEAPAEVELPHRDGRGLIRGAIAGGAIGWGAALGTVGAFASGCPNDGRCNQVGIAALFVTRWIGNGAALGLAIPGAYYRGRYDATAEHHGLARPRDSRRFVIGGATALGIGVAGWLATRFIALDSVLDGRRYSDGAQAGYYAALQFTWSLTTVGAGFLTYGVTHENQRHRFGGIRVVPQLGLHDAGLTLAGRF